MNTIFDNIVFQFRHLSKNLRVQRGGEGLLLLWDNQNLYIEKEDNGNFYIEYYHRLHPNYDLEYYNVKPNRIYHYVDNIYNFSQYHFGQLLPNKKY